MKRTIAWTVALTAPWLYSTAVAQAPPSPPPVTGHITLPHDLSPWGMFLGADIVVKGVLIGLAAASVLTWTIALVTLFRRGSALPGYTAARR